MKIDFIGIGAPKSATSWIFQCLKEHPQVCVSNEKETYFFNRDADYDQGMSYYETFFNHCKPDSIVGEFTADYLASPKAAGRIKQQFPNAKIIACLRDPAERTYSHYYYDHVRGKRPESFDQALKQNPGYIQDSYYADNLERYLTLFDQDKVLVTIYEDIETNPEQFIKNIYRFLEIDDSFIPTSLLAKVNPSTNDRLYVAWLSDTNFKKMLAAFKGCVFGRLAIRILKAIGLAKIILYLKRKNLKGELSITKSNEKRPPMSSEIKQQLDDLFKNDITKLKQLINQDLSQWN